MTFPVKIATRYAGQTYYFDYNFAGGILKCELEYTPEEKGSWEDGFQMEPDYPADMCLHAAYIDDIDVSDLLSESTVVDIEIKALEDFNE